MTYMIKLKYFMFFVCVVADGLAVFVERINPHHFNGPRHIGIVDECHKIFGLYSDISCLCRQQRGDDRDR
jgi:hypothetical protein